MPTRATPELALAFRGAFDWERSRTWFAEHAIPGVDGIDGDGRYVRSIRTSRGPATIAIGRALGRHDAFVLSVRSGPDLRDARTGEAMVGPKRGDADGRPGDAFVARVRRMLDLDADIATIEARFARDPVLAAFVALRPGLRMPGAWDGYELAVRAVLGQQVTVAAGSRLAGAIVRRFGEPLPATLLAPGSPLTHAFPLPETLAESDVASIGMPPVRAEAVRHVARAAIADPTLFEPAADLARSVARLRALPGIGEWTAQYVAMRALGEPDAFPAADIGVLRALARDGRRPSERDALRIAEAWRPWRAYAVMHLWAADAERRRRA